MAHFNTLFFTSLSTNDVHLFSLPWSLNKRLLHSGIILIIKGSVNQKLISFSFLLNVLLLAIFIFIYQSFFEFSPQYLFVLVKCMSFKVTNYLQN